MRRHALTSIKPYFKFVVRQCELRQGQTNRLMEQNREPKIRPIVILSLIHDRYALADL